MKCTVSFVVDVAKQQDIVTSELKNPGDKLVVFKIAKDEYDLPVNEQVMDAYAKITKLVNNGILKATYTIGFGGLAEAVSKMAFGNKLGANHRNCNEISETANGKGHCQH